MVTQGKYPHDTAVMRGGAMDIFGTTRGRILALIKEHGRSHPDFLAECLGLATTSIRQHLAALQRDGYVEPEEVREGTGRPRREYTVTHDGDALFPKRYDALAATLLRHGREHPGADLIPLFVEGEVARQKTSVNGYDTRTRMAEVAGAMREDGGMARVVNGDESLAIVEPNCVYASVAAHDRSVCDAHQEIVERLLAVPVTFTRTADPHRGGCSWRLTTRPAERPAPEK